ncbi:hypothetical protein [Kitasatospora cineracea]|uniref:Lipoprotein n=1 Tax=Kitasatospora cineracea TaxID=88074 RepID=A0A8G1UA15_9ACTN|nr:hypothetical protein [Kitasatospora cineracea]ROR35629.1 hypothetical protein EDD39_7290 [Kitasatospora cineracea]
MRTTGRTFLAVAAVALALTATGCGSKGAGGDAAPNGSDNGNGNGGGSSAAATKDAALTPAALLKMVGDKTSAAKSAKVELVTEIGGAKNEMKGAIAWDHGMQGQLTGSLGGALGTNIAKAGGDGSFTARYLGDAMYVNMGDGMASQLGGAHWIKYNYADLAKLMGPSGESLKKQLQTADPIASVRALIASGKINEAGTETVNGAKTTKYTGDVTADDLAGQAIAQGLTQEQVDGLKQQLATAGATSDHIEVWITADNLLAKKVEQLQMKAGLFTATGLYSDYGTQVETSAPQASDTVDFTELMNGAKTGS